MNSVFGPLRQISYVVTDIDEAIERWHHQVGLGPFAVARECAPFQNATYRGQKIDELVINLGFAYIGELQLELIEQCNDAPSIYREALERGRTSPHHYGVCVEDFAAQRQRALEHGFSAVVDVASPGARMSYLESREIEGLIFELIEWNEATRGYFDGVQQFLSQVDPAQLKHEFPI